MVYVNKLKYSERAPESDFHRRQILTYKEGPRTERVSVIGNEMCV